MRRHRQELKRERRDWKERWRDLWCSQSIFGYAVLYSKLLLESQRREKMERRQAVVETELKLCKCSRNTRPFFIFKLQTFCCRNRKTVIFATPFFFLNRGSSQRPERTRGRFQDLIRGSDCEFLDLYLTWISNMYSSAFYLLVFWLSFFFFNRITILRSPNCVVSLRSTAPSNEWVVSLFIPNLLDFLKLCKKI